jgi:hypothetical protein
MRSQMESVTRPQMSLAAAVRTYDRDPAAWLLPEWRHVSATATQTFVERPHDVERPSERTRDLREVHHGELTDRRIELFFYRGVSPVDGMAYYLLE